MPNNPTLSTPRGRREPATAAERALLTFLKADATQAQQVNAIAAREGWPFASFSDFVLRHGSFFDLGPIPNGLVRGTPQRCFGNCGEVVEAQPEYVYAEGFGLSVIPSLHAWLTTPELRAAIDLTWDVKANQRGDLAYFGVAFHTSFVPDTAYQRGVWGVLDDWKRRWPILRGECAPERMLFAPIGAGADRVKVPD